MRVESLAAEMKLYAWGKASPFMAGMRGNNFILVTFLFL